MNFQIFVVGKFLRQNASATRSSRGMALVVALLALAVISLIGLTLMFVSTTETLIERNNRVRLTNSYAAETACEEARNRLSGFLSDPVALLGNPGKVVYIVSAPSIDPTGGTPRSNPYFDPELRSSSGVTLVLSNLNRPGFAWVRITQKTERWAQYNLDDSSHYLSASNTNLDEPVFFGFSAVMSRARLTQYVNSGAHQVEYGGTPVYQLTVLVRDQDGSKLSVNSDISRVPIPPLYAAFYSKDALSIATSGVEVRGEDESGSSSSLDALESQNTVTGDLSEVNGAPNSVDPGSRFSYDMDALSNLLRPPISREIEKVAPAVTRLSDGAFSGDGLNLGRIPLEGDYSEATYCEGSLVLSNSKGQGILFVNGDLRVSGTFSYYGLIIARGKIDLTGDTASGVEIHGAVVSCSDAGTQTSTLSGKVRILYHAALIQEQFNSLGFTRLTYRDAL